MGVDVPERLQRGFQVWWGGGAGPGERWTAGLVEDGDSILKTKAFREECIPEAGKHLGLLLFEFQKVGSQTFLQIGDM